MLRQDTVTAQAAYDAQGAREEIEQVYLDIAHRRVYMMPRTSHLWEEGLSLSDDCIQVSQAETICIRTTKVYDWCFKNGTTNFVITDLVFPVDTSIVAGIECLISVLTCAEIGRDQAGGGIAIVTLRKQATFDLTFVDADGLPVPVIIDGVEFLSQTRTRFFDEFVQVCAPEGTVVNCEVTDSGCRATITTVNGTAAVSVDVFVCQSIQVEADVKVCIDINDFCVPDICAQVEKPFACPPTQFFPPQCDPADPRFTPPCAIESTSHQWRR